MRGARCAGGEKKAKGEAEEALWAEKSRSGLEKTELSSLAARWAIFIEDRDFLILWSPSGNLLNSLIHHTLHVGALCRFAKCDLSHCRYGFFLT